MRQDYQRMQEEIMPGKDTQDWMWEEIQKKAARKQKRHSSKRRFMIALSVAAATLVLVILQPQTSWAEQITGFLKEFFYAGKSADVEKSIVQNVYEDVDKYGHVRMQIQEMLSDGACAYCNICYEALDEEGERWLAEKEINAVDIRFPCMDEEESDLVDGLWIREQKEQATQKTRYFTLFFGNISGKFNLKDKSITMFYPMYKSQGIGKIKIVSNLDTVSYRLSGDKSPSEYYEPRYLVVSKLSYAIFGKDHGVSGDWMDKDGVLHLQYSKGFLAEKGDDEYEDWVYFDGLPLSFTMKDGSKLDMGFAQSMLCDTISFYASDLLISSGQFNVDIEEWNRNMPLEDPGALTGIEIDGVYYDLVKEEPRG